MSISADEIEDLIKNEPQDKCAAFAVRCALRVLPLLATIKEKSLFSSFTTQSSEAFWFWMPEKRSKHLLAIFRAYSCSIEYALTNKYVPHFIWAAVAIDAEDDADFQNYVCAVTKSISFAAEAAKEYSRSFPIDAALAANHAHTVFDANGITQETFNDLARLKELSTLELLNLPLWSSSIPNHWQPFLIKFKQNALSLNTNFDVWLNWYDDRLQGKPINIAQLQQWNKTIEENKKQNVALINTYLHHLV
jgi:hypothetical protein